MRQGFRLETVLRGQTRATRACGAVFQCPADEPRSTHAQESDTYDILPDRPVAASILPPTANPAPLAYRPKDDVPAKAEPETIKNLYMPLWLLAGGVIIEFVAAYLRGYEWRSEPPGRTRRSTSASTWAWARCSC